MNGLLVFTVLVYVKFLLITFSFIRGMNRSRTATWWYPLFLSLEARLLSLAEHQQSSSCSLELLTHVSQIGGLWTRFNIWLFSRSFMSNARVASIIRENYAIFRVLHSWLLLLFKFLWEILCCLCFSYLRFCWQVFWVRFILLIVTLVHELQRLLLTFIITLLVFLPHLFLLWYSHPYSSSLLWLGCLSTLSSH